MGLLGRCRDQGLSPPRPSLAPIGQVMVPRGGASRPLTTMGQNYKKIIKKKQQKL
jgi:hypothetical protein